jgi:hypothetical protein
MNELIKRRSMALLLGAALMAVPVMASAEDANDKPGPSGYTETETDTSHIADSKVIPTYDPDGTSTPTQDKGTATVPNECGEYGNCITNPS